MTFLVVEKGYRFYCSYQKKLLFSYYWLSTLLSNLYNIISMTTIPPHEMYNEYIFHTTYQNNSGYYR